MRMPRWLVLILFGRAKNASRRFASIKEMYQRALAMARKPPRRSCRRFGQRRRIPSTPKNSLVEKWNSKGNNLIEALRDWQDESLDKHLLPYPVLGNAETLKLGELANRNLTILHMHDRFGHRLDEVEFHPVWHE